MSSSFRSHAELVPSGEALPPARRWRREYDDYANFFVLNLSLGLY